MRGSTILLIILFIFVGVMLIVTHIYGPSIYEQRDSSEHRYDTWYEGGDQ